VSAATVLITLALALSLLRGSRPAEMDVQLDESEAVA
jgi:hypothetical protein